MNTHDCFLFIYWLFPFEQTNWHRIDERIGANGNK